MTQSLAPPYLAEILEALAQQTAATAELLTALASFQSANLSTTTETKTALPDWENLTEAKPAPSPALVDAISTLSEMVTPAEIIAAAEPSPNQPLTKAEQADVFAQIKALPTAKLAAFVAAFKAEFGATKGRNGRETIQDRIVQWKHIYWFSEWVVSNEAAL